MAKLGRFEGEFGGFLCRSSEWVFALDMKAIMVAHSDLRACGARDFDAIAMAFVGVGRFSWVGSWTLLGRLNRVGFGESESKEMRNNRVGRFERPKLA